MLLAVLLIIFLFFAFLGIITNHGDTQKVPYIVGMSYDEAVKTLEAAGLEAGIQDSIYADTAKALQVLRQSPDADAEVKAGRTIYLTINRAVPPQVDMPDLRGFSVNSAELYLQSLGLKMGRLTYVPDIARNAVKDQMVGGKSIAPGTKINMGSLIDLVIGNGLGAEEMDVPDLTGMTVEEARNFLSNNNLEMGALITIEPISDTAAAYIVHQKPSPFADLINIGDSAGPSINRIRPGDIIDVWISSKPPTKDSINP